MPDETADAESPETAEGVSEWDEEATEVDPAFYGNGGISLSEPELLALGELRGRKVLAIGAGNGEDVASLINLGARLTVIDDAESLEPAQALAAAAGLSAEFIADDPCAISVALRTGDYDVVYSGFGALDWMDDLGDWAGGITDCLRTGGLLVLYDEHPFSYLFDLDHGHLRVANSYFGSVLDEDEDEDDEGEDDEDEAVGPAWTMGDVVNALGANGLATVSLSEFPDSDRFETALDRLDHVNLDELACIPAALLLVAIKL
jgi:SAM-dependent methyltransferase